MSLPPLTHHEILGLVEPFTRRGRRLDLDASDRLERRLVFHPIEHPADLPVAPRLREDLRLENPYAGTFRLTRLLTPPGGPEASLVAEGPEPGELLALVEAIAPERQFRLGSGFVIALSRRVDPASRPGDPVCLLTRGVARAGGLTLTLDLRALSGIPADIEIVAEADDPIELPEDLIAVLGWDWAPLKRSGTRSWNSKLRLRGRGSDRSRRAESKLETTAAHLAHTLEEPPRRFHERFVGARWGAAARRMLPILTSLALVLVALAVPGELIGDRPVLRLLLMNVPLLLVALSFTLQEMSRIEIPPLPRPSSAPTWRPAPAPLPIDGSDVGRRP
jgi:hypothetical protein